MCRFLWWEQRENHPAKQKILVTPHYWRDLELRSPAPEGGSKKCEILERLRNPVRVKKIAVLGSDPQNIFKLIEAGTASASASEHAIISNSQILPDE